MNQINIKIGLKFKYLVLFVFQFCYGMVWFFSFCYGMVNLSEEDLLLSWVFNYSEDYFILI